MCRLDPVTHEYTSSHLYDYPSSALISDVLNANLVTPIFAVPSQVRAVYDGLVAAIRSATVETLSARSSNIISLIENQYRVSGWGWDGVWLVISGVQVLHQWVELGWCRMDMWVGLVQNLDSGQNCFWFELLLMIFIKITCICGWGWCSAVSGTSCLLHGWVGLDGAACS